MIYPVKGSSVWGDSLRLFGFFDDVSIAVLLKINQCQRRILKNYSMFQSEMSPAPLGFNVIFYF